MGGRHPSESVAGFARNGRPACVGIRSAFTCAYFCYPGVSGDIYASADQQASLPNINPNGGEPLEQPPYNVAAAVDNTPGLYPDGVILPVPGSASAAARMSGGADPTVSVSVSAQQPFGFGGEASADASADAAYYFVIQGPYGTVPIDLNSDMQESAGINTDDVTTSGDAYLDISSGPQDPCFGGDAGYNCAPAGSGGVVNATLDLDAMTMYTVSMGVAASVFTDGPLASAAAAVDPSFTIDPTFPDASEYTIDFSPSFSPNANPIAVPEPGSLGMFGLGLLVLGGGLGWRRRWHRGK